MRPAIPRPPHFLMFLLAGLAFPSFFLGSRTDAARKAQLMTPHGKKHAPTAAASPKLAQSVNEIVTSQAKWRWWF